MKLFSLFLTIILWFLLNIGLYFVSPDYQNLLQSFKSGKTKEVSDEYHISKEEIQANIEQQLSNPIGQTSTGKTDGMVSVKASSPVEEKDIIMSPADTAFLNLFHWYVLTQLHSHSSLFDITDEYPDPYFEYYNPDLTLYFFPTKTYNEVKEILSLVQDGQIFHIKEVDNFWDSSLYINLAESYDDGFIRILLSYNTRVFWLKISKNIYNTVKQILSTL